MFMTLIDIYTIFSLFLDNFTTDIDECEGTLGKCHSEAACNNTHGSYVCTCKPGYIGDGLNCTGNHQYSQKPLDSCCMTSFAQEKNSHQGCVK